MNELTFRQALPTDVGSCVDLLYSSGPELYEFIYQTPSHSARDFIAYEFASGRGFCGYPTVTVAVHEGRVVGTACFYDRRRYQQLVLQTVRNMAAWYGMREGVSSIARSRHIASVMKRPKRHELYVANFGVDPTMRSQGIGRAMLTQRIVEASHQGYRYFGLDVAATNPRAQALYESLGLQVMDQRVFSGQRLGYVVPASRNMELRLS